MTLLAVIGYLAGLIGVLTYAICKLDRWLEEAEPDPVRYAWSPEPARTGFAYTRAGGTAGVLCQSGLALLEIHPDRPTVVTPRGVDLDLDGKPWGIGDVARVIETIEAL